MQSPEEISLLNRLKSGDQTALKVLYTVHFPALAKIAARLTGDSVHAKDAVQNTFIHFWHKRENLQIDTSLFLYLRKMVIHEVLAQKRKADRRAGLWHARNPSKTSHTDVEDALLEKEVERAIRLAIDALPERCSEIFKLSRYNEMTYAEIAETLDLSVKTVENQMGKALKILREELREFL